MVESERGGAGVGGTLVAKGTRRLARAEAQPSMRTVDVRTGAPLFERTEPRACALSPVQGAHPPPPSPGVPRSWNPSSSSSLFGRSGVHGRGHAGDQPPPRRVLQQPGLGEGLTWERRGDRGFLREVEDFGSAKGELRGILRGAAGGVSRGWTCIPRETGN